MKKTILFVSLIFILISCSSLKEQEIIQKQFTKTFQLFPSEVVGINVLINPQGLPSIAGNHIFLMNDKIDSLVTVFSLPKFQYNFSFCSLGKGPDEYNVPFLCQSNTNYLYILDSKIKSTIVQIDTDSFKIKNKFELDLTESTFSPLVINDSIFYCVKWLPLEYLEIVAYDFKKNKLLHSKKINIPTYEVQEQIFMSINEGGIVANEQVIAYAYFSKDQIDFLDENFNLKKSVIGEPFPERLSKKSSENKRYYLSGYAGKEKLYFYHKNGSLNKESEIRSIEVYSNDGNCIVRYTLSPPAEKKLMMPIFDDTNNKIYFLAKDDNEEYHFVTYDMK